MVRRKTFAWLAGLVYSVEASVLGLKDIMLLKLTQMGTYRVQLKDVLPWLVRSGAGTRDFYHALAALASPVQKIFFLTAHYSNLSVPIAQQPGHPIVQGRLSLNVCLRLRLSTVAGPTSPSFLSGFTCEASTCSIRIMRIITLKLYNLFEKIVVISLLLQMLYTKQHIGNYCKFRKFHIC
jgi:hypothetical protein